MTPDRMNEPITDHNYRPDRQGQWITGRCDLCGEKMTAHALRIRPLLASRPADAEPSYRFGFDCACGCSWGAHRSDGTCEDCGCAKFTEETCRCDGIAHRTACPEWTLPL